MLSVLSKSEGLRSLSRSEREYSMNRFRRHDLLLLFAAFLLGLEAGLLVTASKGEK